MLDRRHNAVNPPKATPSFGLRIFLIDAAFASLAVLKNTASLDKSCTNTKTFRNATRAYLLAEPNATVDVSADCFVEKSAKLPFIPQGGWRAPAPLARNDAVREMGWIANESLFYRASADPCFCSWNKKSKKNFKKPLYGTGGTTHWHMVRSKS